MKEKFDSSTPFLQSVMLFAIGAISFLLISIVMSIVMTTLYPEMPIDDLNIQLKAFPVQYMFVNFLPFQLGFLLTPGLIYSYLIKDKDGVLAKTNLKTVIWSVLLFTCAFFLLPFLGDINIEITKYLGLNKELMAEKEISDIQLKELVGKTNSMSFYVSIAIIGVITGISEEFAFRKFLFHHMLVNTKKVSLALFSSATIFALLHFNYIQLLPLFSFGLVLGMMYYVSGSIIPGVLMHALNNILNVYWISNDSFPEWMGEINLLTTIPATLLLMVLLILQFKKRSNN